MTKVKEAKIKIEAIKMKLKFMNIMMKLTGCITFVLLIELLLSNLMKKLI